MVLNAILSNYIYKIRFVFIIDRFLGLILGVAVYFLILYSLYVLAISNEAVNEILQDSKVFKIFEDFIRKYQLASVYILAQNSRSEHSFSA